MPIMDGKDKKGFFIRFGITGKKYYYKKGNKRSEGIARAKAKKQGKAIKWSQGQRIKWK